MYLVKRILIILKRYFQKGDRRGFSCAYDSPETIPPNKIQLTGHLGIKTRASWWYKSAKEEKVVNAIIERAVQALAKYTRA